VPAALGGLFNVSDHRNHRHRASEPAWPTGDDSAPSAQQRQERTGFWSPLWDEDDEDAPASKPANGHGRRAESNGQPNGHARNGSNGHARGADGGGHRWPEAEPPTAHRAEPPAPPRADPAVPRHAEPPAPPRPAPRRGGGAPVWPSGEEQPTVRRGPQTPLPPGPGGRPPAGPTARVGHPRPSGPPRPAGPGRPGVDPDGPTELLPQPKRGTGPEPQLLTHREPDYDEDLHDDPDLGYEEEDERPLSDSDRKRRRRKIWRRVRRAAYVLTALMIIGPIVAFFVAYQMVEVPNARTVAASQQQVVSLMYGDGKTPLSTIVPQDGTRTFVSADEIPDVVKHAVFAAEDADFETNPGFDIGGVMRAGWNQVTAGTGGGSTITQQYIKKATGNDEASGLSGYTRKFTEVVKAYKMNNQYNKDDILEAYLNTIYFGRSANGIVAAAKAYYGKSLKDLTPSEAALLGGMIQLPGMYKDQAYMNRRWNFVMDQMVQKGWLSAADRKASTFPATIPVDQARPSAASGPLAHIQTAVLDEVERETHMNLATLKEKGYTIETTIDPNAQNLAQAAVGKIMQGESPTILPAMVAVNPTNGEIVAYYGGSEGNGLDWAKQPQEPGSSFKPFDLVALLEQGRGLGERYDGTSGRQFVANGPKIRNASNASCGKDCTVAEAMKRSINTVFYDIALNTVGTGSVAKAAKQAGIQSPLSPPGQAPDANISIGGGNTQVTTVEMAAAYATFAANGIYHTPHLVKRVLTPDGGVVYQADGKMTDGVAAFDQQDSAHNQKIARNVTESLLPIPAYSRIPCAGGRKCAGKTGTHQYGETEDNAKAWMVGYTPQISVAVSMGAEENHKQVPLVNAGGTVVYGSGLPGQIWQEFMNTYLKDMPKVDFGRFVPIGKAVDDDADGGGKPKGDNRSSGNNQPSNTNGGPSQGGGNGGGDHSTNPSTDPSDPDDPTDPGGGGQGPGTILPPLGGGRGGPGNN
jgi:membrane peptidoglycan carboxypeptidase